jgi:hypothetical protein
MTVESSNHVASTMEIRIPAQNGQGLMLDVDLRPLDPRPATSEENQNLNDSLALNSDMSGNLSHTVLVLGKGSISALQVMVYVLGIPLLGGLSLYLWRQSQERKEIASEL